MRNLPRRDEARSRAMFSCRHIGIRAMLTLSLIASTHLFIAGASAGPASISVLVAETQSKAQSNAQMKADCISSVKRGSMGFKDREYLPAYWTRAVSQGSSGYHCWTVDNYSPYGLHWSSDAVNTMNDFIVYGYDVGATRLLTLELKGGWVSFSNKTGPGAALMLAVYEGPPLEGLFKGKEPDFKKFKPLIAPKVWSKPADTTVVKIDPLNIPLQTRGSAVSVVLVGVDSWNNTSSRIDIVGLRLLARTLATKSAAKK